MHFSRSTILHEVINICEKRATSLRCSWLLQAASESRKLEHSTPEQILSLWIMLCYAILPRGQGSPRSTIRTIVLWLFPDRGRTKRSDQFVATIEAHPKLCPNKLYGRSARPHRWSYQNVLDSMCDKSINWPSRFRNSLSFFRGRWSFLWYPWEQLLIQAWTWSVCHQLTRKLGPVVKYTIAKSL